MLSSLGGKADPPRHKNAQHVSVCEQRDVAAGSTRASDHAVHPDAHLLRRFATWASVPEDHPARPYVLDLLGRQPFVLAVVPFDQIGIDDGAAAKTCQRAQSRARAALG